MFVIRHLNRPPIEVFVCNSAQQTANETACMPIKIVRTDTDCLMLMPIPIRAISDLRVVAYLSQSGSSASSASVFRNSAVASISEKSSSAVAMPARRSPSAFFIT
nr:MAG TPA: hypothetical protein [Caudoviricetes sp.]